MTNEPERPARNYVIITAHPLGCILYTCLAALLIYGASRLLILGRRRRRGPDNVWFPPIAHVCPQRGYCSAHNPKSSILRRLAFPPALVVSIDTVRSTAKR